MLNSEHILKTISICSGCDSQPTIYFCFIKQDIINNEINNWFLYNLQVVGGSVNSHRYYESEENYIIDQVIDKNNNNRAVVCNNVGASTNIVYLLFTYIK